MVKLSFNLFLFTALPLANLCAVTVMISSSMAKSQAEVGFVTKSKGLGTVSKGVVATKPPKREGFMRDMPAARSLTPAIGSFGFDTSGIDLNISPGNDFYHYANGNWERRVAVPSDRSNYGMFTQLDDLSFKQSREILEEVRADPDSRMGRLYQSFMNVDLVDLKGMQPIRPMLAAIGEAQSHADIAKLAGELRRDGFGGLIGLYIGIDDKHPDRLAATLMQGGLSLPDRDYYLNDDSKLVELRTAFAAHIEKVFKAAGEVDSAKRAQALLAFQTQIARIHWSKVESREADKLYNKMDMQGLQALAPDFDWVAFFAGSGVEVNSLIVAQPDALAGLAKLYAETPLQVLKDQLLLAVLDGAAPYLSSDMVALNFAFYGTALGGTPQNRERWKRGVELVKKGMGDDLGQIYVERHFPPDAKSAADQMVQNIVAAMDRRLSGLEWMAPETRAKARAKLSGFTAKIGYPDKWRDYTGLKIKSDDLFGNVVRLNRFEFQRRLKQLGAPVDRSEWFMTPMEVNAYANPSWNEIVFPAAILQPPFFDPHADAAINYGGIGAVIGHEISHHFDDQGRKYDASGRLADWWTASDVEKFTQAADRLVAQYDAYEPLAGFRVQGRLTLGENIADLAGLTVAHDAYRLSLADKPEEIIDGFSADQRFYLGWAQIWRRQYRDENLRQRLLTDPHAPSQQRAWVVRNLDPWYDAFSVEKDEALFLDTADRVRIW